MITLLPDFSKPMDPLLWPEAFDNDEYIFQVKWDGVRIIAEVNHGQVSLTNKHGKDKTEQYPELHELSQCLKVKTAILDGEVVVLKEGKPSFPTVMRRDQSQAKNIASLRNLLPINYMVFDLLYLNGRDLRNEPLEFRKSQLDQLLINQASLNPVEDFPSGKLLFDAVERMGMEGIVAKKRTSPYTQDKRHKDWLKVKCRRKQACLIGGYTLRGTIVNSLLLGIFREGSFTYVGKAGSGLSAAQQETLSQLLPQLEIHKSPFVNPPSPKKGYHYVRPQIGVQIEYLEWTEELNLRNPVIKGFLDVDPAKCTEEYGVYK